MQKNNCSAGKPVKQVTEFEAADVTVSNNSSDVLQNDEIGATYGTGVWGLIGVRANGVPRGKR